MCVREREREDDVLVFILCFSLFFFMSLVELIVPLSDKPALCDDPSQLSSLISPESLLSQRTLSQSSSLSDSTNPDSSAALSPDIQTTLAQLNTSNLDIATRRNILLGRTKNKYVCDVCGRECPSKHKLKRHLSTHSEERPFICQICRKSFKWTEYLQKHMRQQHPGGVEGQYEFKFILQSTCI